VDDDTSEAIKMSALTDELFWSMRLIRLNWDFPG